MGVGPLEWMDVVKRAGQTTHLGSLLLLTTSIKWRRPDNVAPLVAVTTLTVVLQLVATVCERGTGEARAKAL